ncbi:hypothetical protein F4553_006727 [Allocatelliglobosispora scoriae]|uniref:Uncharacterized protein n=1 Tax=Allocatelliglobosispora scoriae TaxID=643052 RepID=A0A841C2C8_9ACTN|nr:hypothetical protein [Allocatelliglobosispora scoriae]MBB5873293.1 hypothetical protein [Allocatelliglobosispora scoriae]
MMEEELRIDGVRTSWIDIPARSDVAFLFDTGPGWEHVDIRGVTRLGMQAVIQALPPAFGVSSMILPDGVSFRFDGPNDRLGAVLGAICGEVSGRGRPRDLARAARTAPDPHPYSVGLNLTSAWASLVGRQLPGRAGNRWPEVDLRRLTDADVARHLADNFTTGRAGLALHAKPPADLRLPLPPGPGRPPATPSTGFYYRDTVIAPGLSLFAAAHSWEVTRLMLVLSDRVDAPLQAQGHYPARANSVSLSDDSALFGLCPVRFEPAPAIAAATAQFLWRQAHLLAEQGPTAEELPEFDDAGLAAYRTALHETATVVLPYGTETQFPGLPARTCWTNGVPIDAEELTPGRFQRRPQTARRLLVSPQSVSVANDGGVTHTTNLADLLIIVGKERLWLGDLAHHCVLEISEFAGQRKRLLSLVQPVRVRTVAG